MKLPSEFEARTLEWMGEETYRALEAALQTEPPVSIRVNRTKWSGEVTGEPVLWASAGVYLSQRPTFTFDPLFHAGCYYVQEASSMFVEQVLRTYITGPVVMLDLCAAPGGKSTHVRSVLPVGSLLVANEVMRNRSQVLAENLIKWENVAWIADELGAEILKVPVVSEWGIIGNLAGQNFPVYRFLPHRVKGEGFFLAVLRKSAAISHAVPCICCRDDKEKITKKKRKGEKGNLSQVAPFPKEVKSWLKQAEDFRFEVRGTKVIAFPNVHLSEYDLFRQELKVVHAGVTIGELKGKDVIPDHSLAMSTQLNHDGFSCFELTYEQAIAYLRKEAITLDASVPRGYILLTYKNIPLGFAKNIGNRANNLYPQEWRIRSGYLPEELSFVC